MLAPNCAIRDLDSLSRYRKQSVLNLPKEKRNTRQLRITYVWSYFITYEPDLLHWFDPQSKEKAFPCPRTWEFVSNIVKNRNGIDPATERAIFRGTVGEAAAVEFSAFLNVWRELPHPRAVLNDPGNAHIPENASALMALCGSLYRLATDVTMDAIVTFAQRLRREVGESLVGACVRRDPALQRSPAFIRWAAARTQ